MLRIKASATNSENLSYSPQPLTGEGLGGGELGFIPPSPPSPPARGEDSFEESYFYGKGF